MDADDLETTIAQLRKMGGPRAEAADILEDLMRANAEMRAAPQGVTPMRGSRSWLRRRTGRLMEIARELFGAGEV